MNSTIVIYIHFCIQWYHNKKWTEYAQYIHAYLHKNPLTVILYYLAKYKSGIGTSIQFLYERYLQEHVFTNIVSKSLNNKDDLYRVNWLNK